MKTKNLKQMQARQNAETQRATLVALWQIEEALQRIKKEQGADISEARRAVEQLSRRVSAATVAAARSQDPGRTYYLPRTKRTQNKGPYDPHDDMQILT